MEVSGPVGRMNEKHTPLHHMMIPSSFVAFGFFIIVITLDVSITPATVIIDSVTLWWIMVLFLTTLKDSFIKAGGN